ncbi:MAG: hypothetical protein HZB19_19840 [Chloroflexi bacterium]|nr:hypothetical protein [Chloroflexota bacterium]
MPEQIPEELTSQIIERLTNSESVDDIIMDVCNEEGLDWGQAEMLVKRIHAENKNKIVLAQSPLLVLLALGVFLTGVGLIVYDLYQIYLDYVYFSKAFVVYLTLNGEAIVGTFFLGLVMIIGSLKGMQAVWEAIFEWMGWWSSE